MEKRCTSGAPAGPPRPRWKSAATLLVRDGKAGAGAGLLIGLFAFVAFRPTLKVGFMIDDPFLLQAVERDAGAWQQTLLSDLTESVDKHKNSIYYRPALALVTRAEHGAWGRAPRGYHWVSLLFHASNAMLLFALFVALSLPMEASFAAALLYAVHPVIIDDLFAATGGESMANFFLLASLLLLVKGRPAAGLLLSAVAFFAKESNVVLPALAALCFLRQHRPLRAYWPLPAMLPALVTYLLLRHHAISAPLNVNFLLMTKFLFQAFPRIAFHYLSVLLAPLALETWPPVTPISHFWPVYLLVAGGAAAAIAWRGSPDARFCLGWFLITFAPRIPAIMHNNVLMDKWVSLSSPALFLGLGLALRLKAPRAHWARWGIIAGLALFWITVAQAEVKLRGSDEKNYLWTIRQGPREFANYRLGLIYLQTGRPTLALKALEPIVESNPSQPDYSNAFALALWYSGRRATALEWMRRLRQRFPSYPPVERNLQWMAGTSTPHDQ